MSQQSPETTSSETLLNSLREELKGLLRSGYAHASFEEAVKDFPAELRGLVPAGLPYSAWQIVEHIRIAQQDMLHFSDNAEGKYTELRWPEDYWPNGAEPPSEEAWDGSIRAIQSDGLAFRSFWITLPGQRSQNLFHGVAGKHCCVRHYRLQIMPPTMWAS